LVRLVRGPGGEVGVDWRGKLPGRGWYLHPTPACFARGLKPASITKVFGTGAVADRGAVLSRWRSEVIGTIEGLIGQALRQRLAVVSRQALATWLKAGKMIRVYSASDFDPRKWDDPRTKEQRAGGMTELPFDGERLGALSGREGAWAVGVADEGISRSLDAEIAAEVLIRTIEKGGAQ
jgi:hypothetical protein